ncbi:hypothetical protein AMJ87_07205 [candidate division WOR_3 bacterium SM23_60]|uniref:Uncharacterized protein n=1 Tax=candidate division WOR_3 bacterium SM23_60 TaxID=1703780 RepID=A0A0S8GGS6_UNCW3|nr:MAG: hypothetical protein AMJ87_07205 [candidate division WOR_3 bacterium SM23_60]
MIFGVPKELPPFKGTPEYRVGLSPMGVNELMSHDIKVYVESKAGENAGFSDLDYERAGATVVYTKEEAYRRADVVLKVRRPQQEEYDCIKEGQTIMGFIHLVTARKDFIQIVREKKITLIGYEIPGIPPAEVMILGAGALGCNAARSFAGIGANVHVLDIERDRLDYLACHTAGMKVTTMFATRHNISMLIPYADVIICAVLVPGKRSPILITREMVKKMRSGSVIIDFSIDQGGCAETSKISPSGKFIYTIDGVRHFCMPNATTLVARTATHTITSSTYPYLKIMCELGLNQALKENSVLKSGMYAENGLIRKEYLP